MGFEIICALFVRQFILQEESLVKKYQPQ